MAAVQVELSQEDLEALQRLSARQGVPVEELVKRGVRKVLDEHPDWKPPTPEQIRRAREVAGKFRSGVPDLGLRHDDYLAEIYEEDLKRQTSS